MILKWGAVLLCSILLSPTIAVCDNQSNWDIAVGLFRRYMNREPALSEAQYWAGQLNSGAFSVDQEVGFFSNTLNSSSVSMSAADAQQVAAVSLEATHFRNWTAVTEFFRIYGGMNPTPAQNQYWADLINAGTYTIDQEQQLFAGSSTYINYTHGQSWQAVCDDFQVSMGRQPTFTEAQTWADLINNGTYSYDQAKNAISALPEALTYVHDINWNLTVGYFNKYLGRAPSFNEAATWADFLNNQTYTPDQEEMTFKRSSASGLWYGRNLDSSFTLGSDPAYTVLNQSSTPWMSLYVDAQHGSDANSGTSMGSALRTIEKAQSLARSLAPKMAGNLVINLAGTFTLLNSLSFNSQDSGQNGFYVIYRSYGPSQAVLSGGTAVSGSSWSLVDPSRNLWTAKVGSAPFRNIYINGSRVPKFKGTPINLELNSQVGVPVNCGNQCPIVASNTSVEMVIFEEAFLFRCQATLSAGGTLTPDPTCWQWLTNHAVHVYPIKLGWLEGSPALLNQPGTWAQGAPGTIYYIPNPGENLSQETVVAPNLPRLVSINNSKNLVFEDIQFSYSDWELASDDAGFVNLQADTYWDIKTASTNSCGQNDSSTSDGSWYEIPAAVDCAACQHVVIMDSQLSHLGGAGVNFGCASQNNLFFNSEVKDTSASGIQIGEVWPASTSDPYLVTGTVIENSTVANTGSEFFGSTGIFQFYAANSKIVNNTVHDTSYSGISVGWGWSQASTVNNLNNLISANHVYNALKMMQDGGGIYTLSRQDGTVISHNYVHDLQKGVPGVTSTFGFDLYLDAGSSFIQLNNNVLTGAISTEVPGQDIPSYSVFKQITPADQSGQQVELSGQIQESFDGVMAYQIMKNAGPRF